MPKGENVFYVFRLLRPSKKNSLWASPITSIIEFLKTYSIQAYIVLFAIVSIALGFLATSTYGPAVSGDSIAYLSVAENLLSGRGMVDSFGGSLTHFPPLLPVILAGCSRLFQSDVFKSAWVLNLVLLGINFVLSNIWLYKFFQNRLIYFFIGAILILFSESNLRMHTAVLSEPLYLTFILLFFIFGWEYIEKRSTSSLLILLLIAILSPLLRFSGFSQVIAGVLLIIYVYRKTIPIGLLLSGAFGFIAILPISFWLSMDNALRYKIFIGDGNQVNLVENLLQSFRKIMYWFLPYRPFSSHGFLEPVILVGIIFILLLLINKKKDWKIWLQSFWHPAMFSMMLFTLIYFSSTTTNIISTHHRDLSSDRYYVVIMLPILVLIFNVFDFLVLPHLRFEHRYLYATVFAIILVWSIYPVVKIKKYIDISRQGEPHYYNVYNLREYRESQTLAQIHILLKQKPDMVIYSNLPRLVWLHTRLITRGLPEINQSWGDADIIDKLSGWPGEWPGYIVFLNNDPYKMYYSPQILEKIATMELLYDMEDGKIYYVSAK